MVSSPDLSPARGSTARKVVRSVVIELVFKMIVVVEVTGLVVVAVLVVVVVVLMILMVVSVGLLKTSIVNISNNVQSFVIILKQY